MAYTASTTNLLTSWLRDWHADGLTDLQTDCLTDWLTYWLIDWPTCWLTVWPTDWLFNSLTGWLTDWLTDWFTCWETEWLTGRVTDGLSETVMGRLVDCCWPVLLNLQANFLTMWVLPGLYHFFLTDWWWKRYGWLVVYWFRLCYQSWLNEYRVRPDFYIGWLTNHLTGLVTG